MRLVISAATRHLIEAALDEDDVVFCATSAAFFDGVQTTARFLAKQDLVLAGVDVARAVFASIGADVEWEMSATDGDAIPKGTQFGTVRGDAGMLLRGERTALNFLQRMSGVATLTRSYADALGERVRITDTRKTLPGWRALDKYAVRAGGGANHRYSLSGGVMIKDNHIAAAGGLAHALVGAEAPAVAEQLPGLRGVAERANFDAIDLPGRRHVRRVRRQDGDPVSSPDQPTGQVANERPRRVVGKPGKGLGEKEKVERQRSTPEAPEPSKCRSVESP